MAGKKKPGKPVKGINIKLRMINDLIDVTGSAKDSWNPAEISDDMKAIAYIHDLADTWNPAQLNEALKYLGFATIDSWNPAIIEETKNKLVKYFLPTNASGNPIELDLKGALPYEATSLTIDLLPIQDLHGYESPWAGGAGKNKLQVTMASSTSQDITATVYDDGTVLLNGKSTDLLILTLNNTLTLNGNYILSGCPSGGSASTFRMDCYWEGQGALIDSGNGVAISPNGNAITTRIVVMPGVTLNNQLFKPMIRLATETNPTFAPYENICPISGRNSVTLTVNSDDTEITFGQTVYGGTVNVIEGGTSSTYGYIASYDGEELPGAWISDRDVYAAGTTPTTGAEVSYVLATPDELTTPANEIALVNGENILSTNGDTINITYKAILNS